MKKFPRSFFTFFNVDIPQRDITLLRQCDKLRCESTILFDQKKDSLANNHIEKLEEMTKVLKNDGSVELLLNAYRLGHSDAYEMRNMMEEDD